MRRFESAPEQPTVEHPGPLSEAFDHPTFTRATRAQQQRMMLASAQARHDSELAYPVGRYFRTDIRPLIEERVMLDLGCFTGGATVAWWELYKPRRVLGVDVAQVFIDAASAFAAQHRAPAEFRLGSGEAIPYPDGSVDVILTFDVFEHVRSVEGTLRECARVLRPGGRLLVVFPSYYHPIEHHLGLVTSLPGIHYLFSGETLVRAYAKVISERGPEHSWYERLPRLEPWERCNTINGTTYRRFKKLVRQGWELEHDSRRPIGAVGRNMEGRPMGRLLAVAAKPWTYVPGAQEIAMHRIAMVLVNRRPPLASRWA
jgi:SAM-dependent methyltransferase